MYSAVSKEDDFYVGSVPERRKARAAIASCVTALSLFFLHCLFVPNTDQIEVIYGDFNEKGGSVMMMMMAVTFANILYRLSLLFEEIFHLDSRHKKSFRIMIQFVFSVNEYTDKILMFNFVLFFLLLIFNQDVCSSLWVKHRNSCFGIVIVLPVIFHFRQKNNVELDQIREYNKLFYGCTLARWYYYGYLRIILRPDVGLTLQERIKLYEDHHRVTVPVKKLILLLPESCFIHNNLEQHGDDNVQCAQELPPLERDMAGTHKRNYKNTVYQIITDKNTSVRCCVEGVTTLLSLRDMCEASNCGPSPVKYTEELINFYHELSQLLQADPGCANSYELIIYRDIVDGQPVALSSVIRRKIDECLVRERRSA
ncbi:stimulator of interferon genes protein-like [Limulus polyphemus]|uniref:Stimulator of interferon genes protein-like n=1 Tax=Limulus polyphemus TaxID=6850 RepID=A0ABM1SRT2_LIMPO|nr:stimulator of interferon genes protein-like [Limulus polyphemus]